MRRLLLVVPILVVTLCTAGQTVFGPDVQKVTAIDAPVLAITHVRVVDGTGAPAKEDQTVVIANGKIQAVSPAASAQIPTGAKQLDGSGHTLIPGLVGMHDHLYYTNSAAYQRDRAQPGLEIPEIGYTAPRLYMAAGVTTIRTTGSIEPYTDLKIKDRINANLMPGPKIDATAPYLEGKNSPFAQMHELTGPDDARKLIDYWASLGMTSYKAYMNISREDLAAAIADAHKHGEKLTGHLCSVTWHEAIALGIDDFEHGPVFTATDFVKDKKPDVCPSGGAASWKDLDINSAPVQELIRDLVTHDVAVTSTLPVFEAMVPGRPPLQQRVLDAMSPDSRMSYLISRGHLSPKSPMAELFKKEMQFEYAFAKAGGLLLAGPDPTGNGGTLPGFGDQREVELLVEAGFTPVEAIQIATENGAKFLGQLEHIGTIAPGKQADLVFIKGDPSKNISDIENVETVFKDGIGYDSQKLIESVRGQVGIR